MMRKILCLILAVSLTLCFYGCGRAANNAQSSAALTTAKETKQMEITTTTDKYKTAQIIVDVSNALGYNPERFNEIFPQDGILFDAVQDVSDGDTAMMMLVRVLKENNIRFSRTQGHIESIGGLTEGMCGATSGWLFLVNGQFTTESADKFIVNDGDVLCFAYTVTEGDYGRLAE